MHPLLESIHNYLTRYVSFSNPDHPYILSLWTIHTWVVESGYTTPYIYLHSDEKQSGKTLTIEVLEQLVRNPMKANDMTSAVMFRAIEEHSPTILLDEVDTIFHGKANESLRGTINSGYKKGGFIWRLGEKKEPVRFSTFCPKLLSGIDNQQLPDTIADRAIAIKLTRKSPEDSVTPFFFMDVEDEVEKILSEIEDFISGDTMKALEESRPEPMDTISPRQWEISMPLVSIAKLLGEDDQTKEVLTRLFEEQKITKDRPSSNIEALLQSIKEVFEDYDVNRIFTNDILDKLNENGLVWTPRMLAAKLVDLGIESTTVRRGNQVAKGYKREQFLDAWTRYV